MDRVDDDDDEEGEDDEEEDEDDRDHSELGAKRTVGENVLVRDPEFARVVRDLLSLSEIGLYLYSNCGQCLG